MGVVSPLYDIELNFRNSTGNTTCTYLRGDLLTVNPSVAVSLFVSAMVRLFP
jgi:hypothetical protein